MGKHDVRDFTMFSNTDPYAAIVYGVPGSGKSHLMKFIIEYLYFHEIVDTVYVFRGIGNDDYSFMEKTGTVIDGFDEQLLSDIINHQRQIQTDDGKLLAPPMLIVFDDLLDKFPRETTESKSAALKQAQKNGIKNFKVIQTLCTKYRHYNIRLLFTAQSAKQFPQYVLTAIGNGYTICFNPHDETLAGVAKLFFPGMSGYSKVAAKRIFDQKLPQAHSALTYDRFTGKEGFIKLGDFKIVPIELWRSEAD